MTTGPATFGIVGALAAFPRRLAARAVAERGGQLRRGAMRGATHVVFGRKLLDALPEQRIEARAEALREGGAVLLSENAFQRQLGLVRQPPAGSIARRSLIEQSGLAASDLDQLSLFDAFEHAAEPYSFRDLILAKKYARLILNGATWSAIARSIHRSGDVASITALSLEAGDTPGTILARSGDRLVELDGQGILPLFADIELPGASEDPESLFAQAEEAEADGDHLRAAALYARCLAEDPGDSVAAFNRANALRAAGSLDEAAAAYTLTLKIDPAFTEAWFNFAGLFGERGQPDAARRHLLKAVALDPTYADAIYNLAALEYDAGHLAEARRWWLRYLEIDATSEWATKARRGIKVADMHLKPGNVAG